MSESNWKKHLLKTGVPLEHEAARILSQSGFWATANFPYYRLDGGVEKEFSVDVRGVTGYETPGKVGWGCVLDVLVECNYRSRGTTWLFLPHPKQRSKQLHESVQSVDLLSPRFVHGQFSFDENERTHVCYSAVEVGTGDQSTTEGNTKDRAFESQLRHGIRQLQYALPALLALRARWVALLPPDKNFPFFFVPILLTNAQLVVANHDFGIQAVEKADSLENLGTVVSRVIWSAELGPDFDGHCQRQLANLPALIQTKNLKAVEERRKAAGLADWLQPSAVASRIAFDGAAAGDIAQFTEVLVVNVESLSEVVESINKAFLAQAKSVSDEPLFRG